MLYFAIYLLLVPLVSAILVALLGAKSAHAVRWAVWSARSSASQPPSSSPSSSRRDSRVCRLNDSPLPDSPIFQPEMKVQFDLVPYQTGSDGNSSAIQFFIGIDGLNVWLVVLTALLMVSSVLVSWKAVQERVNEFYAWMLLLQAAMVGVFLSFDIVLFYVFFELTLVPLFFLIGIWGGPQRQYAARKFFVYTLTGSLITLLGVLGIVFALPQALADCERAGPTAIRAWKSRPSPSRLPFRNSSTFQSKLSSCPPRSR